MRNRADISTLESTKYEVGLVRDGKIVYVLGYTARKSKTGILNLNTKDIARFFTQAERDGEFKYSAKSGFVFNGGSIRMGFTGRTKREVANGN